MFDMARVAIYFQMFSPYIIARLQAAATACDLIGIEGSRRSAAYAWEPITGGEIFERHTLFSDQPIEDVAPNEIASSMRRALDLTDPDIVVACGWSQPDALTMLLWARERGRPAILMSESTAVDAKRNWLRELIKGQIVKQFDAALVGGQPQENYVKSLGLEPSRIFRGYNVVDNDFFAERTTALRRDSNALRQQLGLPDRYFLASNRFIEKKNLARLVEAYRLYRFMAGEDAWHLVLMGDGPLRAEIESQVLSAGLSECVHFPGFKQYDELPLYYAMAGAFCHVSTIEQWGLVVNEAMASGLPVLVSQNCGCARDLVHDGKNGWLVDPLDIGQMADRLGRLSGTDDIATMGEESRNILAAFHPRRFCDGLQSAINAIDPAAVRQMSWYDSQLVKLLATRKTEFGK